MRGQRAPDQPFPYVHLPPAEKKGFWDLMLSLRTREKSGPCVKRNVGFQGGSEPWFAGSPPPATPKAPCLHQGQVWTIHT